MPRQNNVNSTSVPESSYFLRRRTNAMKPFVSDQEVHITRGSIVSHISTLVLFLCLWLTDVSSRPNYKYLLQAESPSGPELRNSYDTWESAASVAPWEPPVAPADEDDNQRSEALSWNHQTNIERDYHYTSRMYYTLTLLNDTNALCNDGTQAGYYYRRSKGGNSQNWLIFLEGGWYCFDNTTCQLRESSTFSLFSSSSWPQQRPSSNSFVLVITNMRLTANCLISFICESQHRMFLSLDEFYVTNSGQPINFRFTRNSTLLFLSRLISMLNNRSKQSRHQPVFSHTSYPRKPTANDPGEISQNLRTSETLLVNSNKKSLLQYEPSSALIVRPHGSREQRSLLWPQYRRALKGLPSPDSSHVPRNEYLLYHLIDSCGLAAGSNRHGPYVCSEKDPESATKIQIKNHREDQLDNLIPQCNPTCGFLSNPQRMKLVDVLALYEINTEVLAKILGLTSSELRNLKSEEQMKLLFCGNSRLKRHLLSRRRRGTI
ncbi:hypothetical protein T265_07759 [Opisthorchis viverrini]|uniref:Uncharacterized protein n=1 Tax=Opisthorchis viverrini TaxID=6198 RepID=A0A074ZBE5_OPIVI|nr:hypothetical protein T265_07759 [Opisthorchis viverrini]KER24616.1 hypothetical protein T265_07759 [Opisthorchis viverrini]